MAAMESAPLLKISGVISVDNVERNMPSFLLAKSMVAIFDKSGIPRNFASAWVSSSIERRTPIVFLWLLTRTGHNCRNTVSQ